MANETIKGYVVGLMFRENLHEVALIRKNRPTCQAGKLNGIGGKVEPGEDPYSAMVREFREEADCVQVDWNIFAETYWQTGYIRYFTCRNESAQLKSLTDEKVDWYNVADLPAFDVVPNTRWIVPMAIQWFHEPFFASVDYSNDPLIKAINDSTNNPST